MSKISIVSFKGTAIAAAIFGAVLPAMAAAQDLPVQPRLGFDGQLVNLSRNVVPSPENVLNLGLQMKSLVRGGVAAQMGLEPGDIIVSIDSMRFTTFDGYQYALRAAGQRPSIMVIDVRTNKLRRKTCNLPHAQPPEHLRRAKPPETYLMMIDLAEDMRR